MNLSQSSKFTGGLLSKNKYNQNKNSETSSVLSSKISSPSINSKNSKICLSNKNSKKTKSNLKSICESIELDSNNSDYLYNNLHKNVRKSLKENNLPEKLNFSKGVDEWDEIVKYDQKLFHEENLNNKLKDIEIKRRIREDLDNQIKLKMRRNQEEYQKEREYDEIMKNHCNVLEDLEKKRQMETKERALKEKENRDKQLMDEQQRKKEEILKEKKYDREYVRNILSEIEKDKQIQLKRRMDERELMLNTLKENQLNKQRQLDNKERERLIDIRYTGEYGRVLDKQEQERTEYFKKIERNANNFVNKMALSVMNELESKNKDEEERMRNYLLERERR